MNNGQERGEKSEARTKAEKRESPEERDEGRREDNANTWAMAACPAFWIHVRSNYYLQSVLSLRCHGMHSCWTGGGSDIGGWSWRQIALDDGSRNMQEQQLGLRVQAFLSQEMEESSMRTRWWGKRGSELVKLHFMSLSVKEWSGVDSKPIEGDWEEPCERKEGGRKDGRKGAKEHEMEGGGC